MEGWLNEQRGLQGPNITGDVCFHNVPEGCFLQKGLQGPKAVRKENQEGMDTYDQ